MRVTVILERRGRTSPVPLRVPYRSYNSNYHRFDYHSFSYH
jgi:hypothetical protein